MGFCCLVTTKIAFLPMPIYGSKSIFRQFLRLSPEATELADKYIEAKVVGKTSRADCQHIAIATLCNADVLVSWNFKHIVNLDRIRGYNGINYQNGHKMIEIRTPKEVIKYENEA
jgi:hypothetical protein